MKYRDFWRELGSIIRHERQRAGRTQKGMAVDLDIPRPSVSLIEAGGRTIDTAELVTICSILGLSIEEVITEALKADPSPSHPWYTRPSKGEKGGEE